MRCKSFKRWDNHVFSKVVIFTALYLAFIVDKDSINRLLLHKKRRTRCSSIAELAPRCIEGKLTNKVTLATSKIDEINYHESLPPSSNPY